MKKSFTLFIMAFALLFSTITSAQCDPPANLSFSYSNNVSSFTWDDVPGAIDYRVQINWAGANWGTSEFTVPLHTYSIANLMQGGNFQFRVRANCGSNFGPYTQLFFSTPCSTPGSLAATNITTTGATLNWVPAVGNNGNTVFAVAYRLAGTTNTWTQLPNTTATSVNVSGLAPARLYEWRVTKICAGLNSNTVTSQFTTATPPCSPPTGLTAVYNNNVTTFSWDAMPGAADYTIQLKYPGYSWANIEYETTVATHSLSLTGIIQSGTFDWRVNTNCGTTISGYTESQVIIPCPAPSGLFTTSITTSSATVNWVPATGLNTYISDFIISYRVANSGAAWLQAGHSFGNSINITGLAQGTVYEWRVNQTCPYFNSNDVMGQFTTLSANGCGTPIGLTTASIGNTNAVVTWTAVPGASSYWLQYRVNNTSAWNVVSNIISTSYTLNNCLSANTTYQYQVRSKCGNIFSAFSPVSSFTTLNCVTNGINSLEWIDLFKLGTINRVSGAETGGYKNTGLSTNLVIGSSNPGQISAGFAGAVRTQNYGVYIDFNRNGRYDDTGERVFGAGLIAGAGNCNFSATIPATATAGITGMRVVIRKTTDGPVSPCLLGFLGEAEDYTVNLVSISSRSSISREITASEDKIETSITVSPNPSRGVFTISLPKSSEPVFYELVNMNGALVQKQNIRNMNLFTIDITRMPKGLYLLRITDQSGWQQTQQLLTF